MKIRLAALLEIPSILKAFMKFSSPLTLGSRLSEADLGLLQHPAINYYHKALHLGCCNSHRSASGYHKIMFFPWGCSNRFCRAGKSNGHCMDIPSRKVYQGCTLSRRTLLITRLIRQKGVNAKTSFFQTWCTASFAKVPGSGFHGIYGKSWWHSLKANWSTVWAPKSLVIFRKTFWWSLQ